MAVDAVLNLYKEMLAHWQSVLADASSVEGEGARLYVQEQVDRIQKHIHNLETDHQDCVEPCCPNCTCRGRKVKL